MAGYFGGGGGSSALLQSFTAGLTIVTNTQVLFGVDLNFSGSSADLIVNGMLIGVN